MMTTIRSRHEALKAWDSGEHIAPSVKEKILSDDDFAAVAQMLHYAIEDIETLLALIDELCFHIRNCTELEVLKEVEWLKRPETTNYCIVCHNYGSHKNDCKLAAAIKKAEEVVG